MRLFQALTFWTSYIRQWSNLYRIVCVWKTKTRKCIQTLEGFTDAIEAIGNCSTQNTQASAIGFSGNNVNVWNM